MFEHQDSFQDTQQYLNVLKEGSTPFDRFVSRGGIKDDVDIPGPRGIIDVVLLSLVEKVLVDGNPRFLPMLGTAGSGKTHAFWAFKDIEMSLEHARWTIVYVPSPPAATRTLFHVYTCITNDLVGFIKTVEINLLKRYGPPGVRPGHYDHKALESTLARALAAYPPEFEPCLKAFIIEALHPDKNKRSLAKRWILGEVIGEKEFEDLPIESVVGDDEICLAMMELIAQNLDHGLNGDDSHVLVLFVDEFESPYRTHGDEAQRKFIATLQTIHESVDNTIIFAAVLKEVWDEIYVLFDDDIKQTVEEPYELQPFSFNDVTHLFKKHQHVFWKEHQLPPPKDPFFPLNQEVIEYIFKETRGNPRNTIKLAGFLIEKMVLNDLSPNELLGKTDREITPRAPTPEMIKDYMTTEEIIYEVNPPTVVAALMSSIREISYEHRQLATQPSFEFDYKFSVKDKEKTIAAIIEIGETRIGIDIPAVKTFDRSGGVAAYYAARRLAEGIEAGIFSRAAIIIPESTQGEKLQFLLDTTPNLHVARINEVEAEIVVKTSLDGSLTLTQRFYEITESITGWQIERKPDGDEENPILE